MNRRVKRSVSDELLESCFTLFPPPCAFLLLPPSPSSMEAGILSEDEDRDGCGSPLSWRAVRSFKCLSSKLAFCYRPWSGNVFVFDPGFSGISGMDAQHHDVESDKNCMATGHCQYFGPIVMVDFTEYIFSQMLLLLC